jgi:hypothetical protein
MWPQEFVKRGVDSFVKTFWGTSNSNPATHTVPSMPAHNVIATATSSPPAAGTTSTHGVYPGAAYSSPTPAIGNTSLPKHYKQNLQPPKLAQATAGASGNQRFFGRQQPVNPFLNTRPSRPFDFGTLGKNAASATPPSPTESIDIDMTDLTPAPPQVPTPPSSSSSNGGDSRRHVQPKPHAQRRVPPKLDVTSEITIEEDDGTLQEGYLGTWKGIQFFAQDNGAALKCACPLHHLACGHWVTTPKKEDCGLNCHETDFSQAAFLCPTCCASVQNIIDTKMSAKERTKITQAMIAGHEAHVIGYLVELVSKHVELKANITETVICIVRGNHSRECTATETPASAKPESLKDQIRAMTQSKKQRQFKARNTMNAAKKRSPVSTPDDMPSRKKVRSLSPQSDGEALYHSSRLVRKRTGERAVNAPTGREKRVLMGMPGDANDIPRWDPRADFIPFNA